MNSHRHIFVRKKPPQKYTPRPKAHTFSKVSLNGSRIINLLKLQQYIDYLTRHGTRCTGTVTLSGELRDGLASVINTECTTCDHTIVLETTEKVKGPRDYKRWECNLAAVWGQMVTGGGHSHLEETMIVVGVPAPANKTFVQTERDIGEWWQENLWEFMLEAGREEKRPAEERGDFHHGVPAITVVVDGGWSKRSHKHSYNAKSGVAVIVGQETGKLLHIGVRNKYCSACAQEFPKTNIAVTRTGMRLLLRWRRTSSWRALCRQSKCMVLDICSSLEMAIAPCIQPFWHMFLIGDLISERLSVLITHASAIDPHWKH